jgi:glutamate decarboxylase
MLAGLAMKFGWRARRRAMGLPADKPNLVMPSSVHTCWPKFCRYWDVEPRYVPIREPEFTVDPADVARHCDENTIGAVAILGSSALGIYDPVAGIAAELDRLQADRGVDVPLHVDAAVGGFIAPFLEPQLVWDFRLPRVLSINTSGHKCGLVYPGRNAAHALSRWPASLKYSSAKVILTKPSRRGTHSLTTIPPWPPAAPTML